MVEYRRKIRTLLEAMLTMSGNTRYANRWNVIDYSKSVIPMVHNMVERFRGSSDQMALLSRFELYTKQEEARLKNGLETAKYDLDGLDTLALVNGRNGLERVGSIAAFMILKVDSS